MNKYIKRIDGLVEQNIPESANVILKFISKHINKWRVTQSTTVAKKTESKANLPWFKYWPFTTPWASSFLPLCLHFLICKIGLKTVTHRTFVRIKHIKHLKQCLTESKHLINVRYYSHNMNNSFTHSDSSNSKLILWLRTIYSFTLASQLL